MSAYGSVPDEDVKAVRSAVRVAGRVASALPAGAAPWRSLAYELVLEGILSDWVANGTNQLEPDDEEDLTSLMLLAADVALEHPEEALRETTFRVVLRQAMADWTANWNLEE